MLYVAGGKFKIIVPKIYKLMSFCFSLKRLEKHKAPNVDQVKHFLCSWQHLPKIYFPKSILERKVCIRGGWEPKAFSYAPTNKTENEFCGCQFKFYQWLNIKFYLLWNCWWPAWKWRLLRQKLWEVILSLIFSNCFLI